MGQSVEWEFHPGALIGAACAVLLVPLRWLAAMFLAACFHEGCHIAVLKLRKRNIHRIKIGLFGAVIETEPLEPGEELLCALAGPAGSLLLMCAASVFPELAVCGLVQGFWNLLPIYPMDGGRALSCILYMICPRKAQFIGKAIRWLIGLLLLFLLCFAALRLPILWIAVVFAAFRLLVRKLSCNQSSLAVQ